jgi:hypothetical protein
MAIEDGTLTNEEFHEHAQAFVDSNVWRSLQGCWQRMIYDWVNAGQVEIKN